MQQPRVRVAPNRVESPRRRRCAGRESLRLYVVGCIICNIIRWLASVFPNSCLHHLSPLSASLCYRLLAAPPGVSRAITGSNSSVVDELARMVRVLHSSAIQSALGQRTSIISAGDSECYETQSSVWTALHNTYQHVFGRHSIWLSVSLCSIRSALCSTSSA